MPAKQQGRCACGEVHYRLTAGPIVVHCCHCRWCQRESGTAFALNALIETSHVTVVAGTPERIDTPSASGAGQKISCHNNEPRGNAVEGLVISELLRSGIVIGGFAFGLGQRQSYDGAAETLQIRGVAANAAH